MSDALAISVGQYSDKGRKDINQDFHGVLVPKEPVLSTKGIAIAIADGISSSEVSHIASEASVRGLLDDYFCTSETWSVKKSADQVLTASNSWLHSQSQKCEHRFDKNKGYVCTLSAMIIKSTTAYIFHLGDSRIYRLRKGELTQLTEDHRTWVSSEKSYLSRAMGIYPHLDYDYQSLVIEQGDIFIFVTDGVYEHVSSDFMIAAVSDELIDINDAAKILVDTAYKLGSTDNLTAQVVRIDSVPSQDINERVQQLTALPFPPILDVRANFDGFKIVRNLHATSRSHVYLAEDNETPSSSPIVIKTPSVDLQEEPAYLERFLMEEWIAKRISSAHVLKPCELKRKRHYLYTAFEFIDGQTLTQWMIDNPKPSLQSVREIVGQIAKGLQAFHRLEMLHQDIRPENIMIDTSGVVKIIDFGSTKVAGLMEMTQSIEHQNILGTAQYTAPEYFLGEVGAPRSDLFSLAVITYQMLTGKLPYGAEVSRSRTKSAQNKLRYHTALHDDREIPAWVDDTLKHALHPNPYKRYQELSEFIYDLSQPSKTFLSKTKAPLLERDPVVFWQSVSVILVLVIVYLLSK
ncbi:bifunctional protein-serine/threonine kinase/phosphatase [Paraglaciecola psychrophila]|uniref:Dual serine/threonine-protein kinase/phosphatase n=1 Tax=Paraglaciecola psychrophila 170 TaxID=1129794 RepID=K7AEF8_9ALTE|nr:bifunctional protein-serine/threonine kinase/phosphatase [Paraglaciecola psychrophila]AGH43002.1 dual serine/threonine-protein kinase/phosphatase [Paraglaciecola psychrophila 170]GAC39033.1 bifunctional serine/threonine kinase and phosphatase [Paraglaciecola psychrophila 170]